MMGSIRWNAAALAVLLVLAGCAPDITETDFFSRHPEPSEAPDDAPRLLGERTVDGVSVALLTRGNLHAGYNRMLVRLRHADTDAIIPAATVQLIPTRRDGATEIPAPLDPAVHYEADDDGLMEAGAYFIQPPGGEQIWDVAVNATFGATTVEAVIDVPVVDSLWLQTVESTGGTPRYYVAWLAPTRPTTGEDDIAFGLFEETAGGFAPVEDAGIDLYPYMDMGGGDGHSTPYSAPAYAGAGRYQGRINFIMSGGWDMTLYVSRPGMTSETVVFRGFIVY